MYEQEFINIIDKIINNRKFKKLKSVQHHYVTNRYDHNLSVAYKVYKLTKFLNLDYVNITRAAVMHDFYFDDDFTSSRKSLFNHPKKSLQNAKKITTLNVVQENIIISHMFPIGGKPPKYKESIIVDFLDDVVSIKEISLGNLKYINTALLFLLILAFNYFK